MKNLPYILIIILLGIIAYLYFKKENIDIKPYEAKIDSLNTLIKKDKLTINNLVKDAEKTEIKEVEYLKEADSLAKIISTLHLDKDCPKIVKVQSKEITALRSGLKKCNESKGIYKVTLGICQDVIVNYEIKEITTNELNKAKIQNHKKEKKRAFIFGAGSGAAIVLLLLLL